MGRYKRKMRPKTRLYWVLGGGGGIRTLGSVATTPDFESGTFDHSATPPDSVLLVEGAILSGAKRVQAAYIGPQHLWNRHRSIGVLAVFQHRHQGAAHGQAGAIQGVHQLVFALRVLKARLQAPRLETFAIGAAANFAVGVLGR